MSEIWMYERLSKMTKDRMMYLTAMTIHINNNGSRSSIIVMIGWRIWNRECRVDHTIHVYKILRGLSKNERFFSCMQA